MADTPADRDSAARNAFAHLWNTQPAVQHLGARVEFPSATVCRVILDPVEPFHRGGLGTEAVNGTVIAALCDAAVGLVGHLQHPSRRVGTAQLSIQFLRPLLGDRVVAVGRTMRKGANLIFARCEVEDEKGEVCAVCDGVVAVVQGSSNQPNTAL